MARRTARGTVNVTSVLKGLEEGRRAAIQVRTEAKISGHEYTVAFEVLAAIDNLAEVLTGDPTYFHAPAHSG